MLRRPFSTSIATARARPAATGRSIARHSVAAVWLALVILSGCSDDQGSAAPVQTFDPTEIRTAVEPFAKTGVLDSGAAGLDAKIMRIEDEAKRTELLADYEALTSSRTRADVKTNAQALLDHLPPAAPASE